MALSRLAAVVSHQRPRASVAIVLSRMKRPFTMRPRLPLNGYVLATFGLFGFLFWHLGRAMLQFRPDGWYVGHVNLYGDLVLHLAFIMKFLETGNPLSPNPIMAGSKMNYPILMDYLTSLIARVTAIDTALFITTFTFTLAMVAIAGAFIRRFVPSERVVFLALLLFFVNAGLGFSYFFHDFFASGKTWPEFLMALPREYTDLKSHGYWWINTVLAYFLPQRGFLIGFPVVLAVLLLLHRGHRSGARGPFVLAGMLAGMLAIGHTHSLFVLFLLCLCYAPASVLRSEEKPQTLLNWALFAAVTAAIALPLFRAVSSLDAPWRFIRVDVGWTSNERLLWFWAKNLGVFGPLLLVALIWLFRRERGLFLLYLPFLAVFIGANIWAFQPWDYDNGKLILYWFFVSTIVVARFLDATLFAGDWARAVLGVQLVLLMTFAGGLDLFRTFTPVSSYRIFSHEDLAVAARVRELTPPDAVILTASNHNHPVPSLTGRSIVLGYHGWLWSHGYDYSPRARDVAAIYAGSPELEALLARYRVGFVLVGPREREEFRDLNEDAFARFPAVELVPGWRLYDVRGAP
jgi:hypothetical protein